MLREGRVERCVIVALVVFRSRMLPGACPRSAGGRRRLVTMETGTRGRRSGGERGDTRSSQKQKQQEQMFLLLPQRGRSVSPSAAVPRSSMEHLD